MYEKKKYHKNGEDGLSMYVLNGFLILVRALLYITDIIGLKTLSFRRLHNIPHRARRRALKSIDNVLDHSKIMQLHNK